MINKYTLLKKYNQKWQKKRKKWLSYNNSSNKLSADKKNYLRYFRFFLQTTN